MLGHDARRACMLALAVLSVLPSADAFVPRIRALPTTVGLQQRTTPVRPAGEDGPNEPGSFSPLDEDSEVNSLGERLSSTEDTLTAAALSVGLAAAAGVEVLDAGAVGSALLVGAAVGWAAENENKYGVGDLARAFGKIGSNMLNGAQEVSEQFEVGIKVQKIVDDSAQAAGRIAASTQLKVKAAKAEAAVEPTPTPAAPAATPGTPGPAEPKAPDAPAGGAGA